MPAVSLTLEESLALVALAEHVGGREQVPFTRPAAKAISKIRCVLPRAVQDELAKLDEHVAIHLAAANPPEGTADVNQTMRSALAARRALLCRYESAAPDGGRAAPAAFVFRPYTLFFSTRAWYEVGHHGGRKDVRCLKLNRFTLCRPTDEAYVFAQGAPRQRLADDPGAAELRLRAAVRRGVRRDDRRHALA